MTVFTARVKIKGANAKEVTRVFDLGDFTTGAPDTDYADAENAINQITGALDTIIDGVISEVTLTSTVSEDPTVPAAGDVFENALVNCFLDAAGEKTVPLYIPAPAIAIFLAATGFNRDVVDTSQADLIQYIQQVSQHAFVSDDEQINTTVGDGMKNGYRVAKNLKLGR